ncbi:MAG: stage III sporulation protein AF [Clostridia bacterium]|nr:stage III sporulation protein AF [Clostridia bacterium]
MDAISGWVKGIASLVLLVTFLEMLVPRSDMKRLVDIVIGIAVIAAVISPIVSLGGTLGFAFDQWSRTSETALAGREDVRSRAAVMSQSIGTRDPSEDLAPRLAARLFEVQASEALLREYGDAASSWKVSASLSRGGELEWIRIDMRGGGTAESAQDVAAVVASALSVPARFVSAR